MGQCRETCPSPLTWRRLLLGSDMILATLIIAGAMPCWRAEEEVTLATNAAMILKALQALYRFSRGERAGVEGEGDSPAPWRGEVWSQTMDGLLQDLQKRIAGEVRFDA